MSRAAATRVSECTAAGRGAVRVLALEGPNARAIAAALCGSVPAPGCLGLRRIVDPRADGTLVDEALVVALAPQSLELHLHGSPAVVAALLQAVTARGAVQSEPAAGPAGLGAPAALEATAAALLPDAPGERAARVLLDQAEGALRSELEELRDALRAGRTEEAVGRAALLRARWATTRRLLEPPRVVLAGPTNAGKSTLFNLLVGHERVLVSGEDGTTRDAIHERGSLGPWVVEWIDTAGERPLGSERQSGAEAVERAGQERARRLRASADLVVWLDRDPAAVAPAGALALATCADAWGGPAPLDRPAVSALRDAAGARAAVEALVRSALALVEEPWTPGAGSPVTPAQAAALAPASLSVDTLEALLR